MESKVTRTHRLSNREKLQQAHKLIEEVRDDDQVGPTPWDMLGVALSALETVSGYPLSESEAFEQHQLAIGSGNPALASKRLGKNDSLCWLWLRSLEIQARP